MTKRDPIEMAKRDRLVDLLRRATANGTHEEVAEAIAADWFPMIEVQPNGGFKILGGRTHGEQVPGKEE